MSSLTITATAPRPPSPGDPTTPTLLMWSIDDGDDDSTPRTHRKPSVGALLREGEKQLSQDDWLKEPHGYLLKPDFRRPEQQRRSYDATNESPHDDKNEVGRRTPLLSSLSRSLTNRHFHRRYFRLVKGNELSFYKTTTDRSRLGAIDLAIVDYVQVSRIKDAPTHSIDLVSRHRIYTLGADTRQDLAAWCVAICHAMRRIKLATATLFETPSWKQFDDVYTDPTASVTLELKRVVATTANGDEQHSPTLRRSVSENISPSSSSISPQNAPEKKRQMFRNKSDHDAKLRAEEVIGDNDDDGKEGEAWFAVVSKVEGSASSRDGGLVKRRDVVVGVNDTPFTGMSYDEAITALRTASFPLTLRCARDVGSRVVMEGWCRIDERLRYLELSRSSLTGTRPVAGGAVAESIDFGFDIGIVTGVENEENAIVLELAYDAKDTVHLEFSTSEEAQRWDFALAPFVKRSCSSLRLNNSERRRRMLLSPRCTSPRLFSPLFRRASQSHDDLAESAALLREEFARGRMSIESLHNNEDSIFANKLRKKLCDVLSSSSETARFRATIHEQEMLRRVSIVLSKQHKKTLWLFPPDATCDDLAIAEVDLSGDAAVSVKTPDFSRLRVALKNNTKRFYVNVDEDDDFKRALYATLMADTVDRSFPFADPDEDEEKRVLGELKFRVVARDPLERDDFSTPWTSCFVSILEPRHVKLYSVHGRLLLDKKRIVSCGVVPETPHRFDVFVDEPRIFYRFEARSAADAKLLNINFV